MNDLTIRLNRVSDSYQGFVAAVLTYVKNKESRLAVIEDYLNSNPSALSADILELISSQEDFYEDAAYAQAKVS